MRRFVWSILMIMGLATHVYGASLWREGANLFTDHKARRPGDIITIIISESSVASHSNSTEREKEAKAEGGPTAVAEGETNLLDFIPFFGAAGKTEYKGEAKTTRAGVLTAKITAQVVKVLPNGNLFIEGNKRIMVNGEEEEILITGVIRPQDIRADNTILSTYIAQTKISYRGGLRFTTRERPGIITRLLSGLANFFF